MAFGRSEKLEGLDGLIRQLDAIAPRLRKKTLRKAISDTAKEIKWAAKAAAPRRGRKDVAKHLTYKGGQLRKSIAEKVKTYPSGATVGIVGARTNFRLQIGQTIQDGSKRPAGSPVFVNPTKYLHLVEMGTRRGVEATHFLQKALRQNLPRLRDRVRRAVEDAITEAARGN